MPVLLWPLYAGVRVRIVSDSVINRVSGPYGILTDASCRNPGGALKPAAGLKLTLLGGFQAQLDAGAALALPTRKAQALLAYLAVPLGQAHPREKLATLLWGDMQDAQARGNLRYTLSRIRKALPPSPRPGLVLAGPSVAPALA